MHMGSGKHPHPVSAASIGELVAATLAMAMTAASIYLALNPRIAARLLQHS